MSLKHIKTNGGGGSQGGCWALNGLPYVGVRYLVPGDFGRLCSGGFLAPPQPPFSVAPWGLNPEHFASQPGPSIDEFLAPIASNIKVIPLNHNIQYSGFRRLSRFHLLALVF